MTNKVIIAMPVMENIRSKTAFSLVHALKDVSFKYDFIMRIGCDLISARTGLVRQALEDPEATHILFVDHDMHFLPKDGVSPIQKLLDHDVDIVGAPYNFRNFPLRSTAVPLDENCDKTGMYKCNVVPTGFLLIKLDVFRKIPEPWFRFGYNDKGEMIWGEDTHFIQKCVKAGIDAWADGSLFIQHIGEYLY